MKKKVLLLIIVLGFLAFTYQNQLPKNFVYAHDFIPDLNVELRYFGINNFVGDTIDGYQANKLIITKPTAEALKLIQKELQKQNLCLLVYDGYRPQRAVNHFIRWAKDLDDIGKKQIYYPKVKKEYLFRDGYIASRSGHSRGSTVDLTIIDANTLLPLDMGSPYDYFGEESWVNYSNISEIQKHNRQLLQTVMLENGFRNYPKEWWHFTLRNELFPETYFDFIVE